MTALIDPFTANFLVGLLISAATVAVAYALKAILAPRNHKGR